MNIIRGLLIVAALCLFVGVIGVSHIWLRSSNVATDVYTHPIAWHAKGVHASRELSLRQFLGMSQPSNIGCEDLSRSVQITSHLGDRYQRLQCRVLIYRKSRILRIALRAADKAGLASGERSEYRFRPASESLSKRGHSWPQ